MSENSSKRRRLEVEGQILEVIEHSFFLYEIVNADAVADGGNENEENEFSIYDLNVGNMDIVFECLLLKDLLALRQTCKWMKRLVDNYINTNYPSAFKRFKIDTIFLKKLECEHFNLIKYASIGLLSVGFATRSTRGSSDPPCTKLLNKLKSLQLTLFLGGYEIYETVLKHCTSLEHLIIEDNRSHKTRNAVGYEWLLRRYPTLTRFDLCGFNSINREIIELKTFLERNPNIQTFGISNRTLWSNRSWMLNSRIELDELIIFRNFGPKEVWSPTRESLNELFERGFFKRLHFCPSVIRSDDWDHMPELRALEKLTIRAMDWDMDFTKLGRLTSLKELQIRMYNGSRHRFSNLILVGHLMHLEKIHFDEASFFDILPLIHHSLTMKQIILDNLCEGTHFQDGIIDAWALNEERKQLAGAHKIIIFIPQSIFLANKGTMNLKFSLIEFKRNIEIVRENFHEFPNNV